MFVQFLLNPAQASQSNLNGIAYVTTRMEWYCNLTERLLSTEHIDVGTESFQAVLNALEEQWLCCTRHFFSIR